MTRTPQIKLPWPGFQPILIDRPKEVALAKVARDLSELFLRRHVRESDIPAVAIARYINLDAKQAEIAVFTRVFAPRFDDILEELYPCERRQDIIIRQQETGIIVPAARTPPAHGGDSIGEGKRYWHVRLSIGRHPR
jgi:hypothetical protein